MFFILYLDFISRLALFFCSNYVWAKSNKKGPGFLQCAPSFQSLTSLVVQLFVQQRSNKPRSRKKRLCAYLCTKSKKEKDKHLRSRKRRHFANGSQAVNLNQGVFSPSLPQGLFTSFAFADNSLSGGSKYRHKALPLLLSEALLRSGSIRSPLPTEVAVAPFTFPFPSTAVVVTEALSGVSASLLMPNHSRT